MTAVLHDLGGSGPTAVIIHATGFHARCYAPLAELLEGVHVVGVDLRGHGGAPAPHDGDVSWTAMAADVIDPLGSLGGDAFLIGHSVGAAVGLLAQAEHGALFSGAYLYEPALVPAGPRRPMPDNPTSIEGARRRRPTFPSRAEALWRYSARPPLDALAAACLAWYVEHGFIDDGDAVRLSCSPEQEARIYEHTGPVTPEHLASLQIPMVLAAGTRSTSSLVLAHPDMAAALPTASLEWIDGLGHLGPLEHPPTMARAIQAHLALRAA